MKRLFASALLATAMLPFVHAQDYPSRAVRMVVPFGPGGVTDITARTLAPLLGEALGASIVVENRAGAATIIGTDLVAKAKPDGYTLLLALGGSLAANPALYKKLPFDTLADLVGVSQVSTLPYVIVMSPSAKESSVREIIALARVSPGALSYASAGSGSGNHLTAELFASIAGVQLLHVPYKSGGAMVTDVMSGSVALAFSGLPAAIAQIKGGKLKAIAVTSPTRVPGLPDIPTVVESGGPAFVSMEWTALLAPAGTPREVVIKINKAVARALENAEAIGKIRTIGADVAPGSPEELEKLLRGDMARWAKLAETVKFEVQ